MDSDLEDATKKPRFDSKMVSELEDRFVDGVLQVAPPL